MRSRGRGSLVLMPAKKSATANSTTAKHVVGGSLHVHPRGLRRRVGGRLERRSLLLRGDHVLGHRERRRRRRWIVERVGTEPCLERRLELIAEALTVERSEAFVMVQVGVDPLHEQGDVDLRLRVREVRGLGGLHARRVRSAEGLRLLSGPAARLIAAPGGRDRGHREQDGGAGIHPPGRTRPPFRGRAHTTSAPSPTEGSVSHPRTPATTTTRIPQMRSTRRLPRERWRHPNSSQVDEVVPL